ncbi:hypothetical protein ORD22_05145 [Sporosarcina sp. GW1-11]|uniref:GerMN domain-containing protein n=1 Tax=Sporosarcina sp. GW1-11 TaxID=2899126 RepID=UPI00294FE732|nr:GerMN domain-containing protein [Sporosarcina sp. GW1-11]MDV6377648.1 hypothetical protein [Sporosarcina sp. GW1-11]
MSKEKWDEEKIDKTLREMPTIEDRRSKEEVFQRLKNDSRLTAGQPKKRVSKGKWKPTIVAVAAVLLLTILVPTFLNHTEQTAMDKTTSQEATESVKMEDHSTIGNENAANEESAESADEIMFSRVTDVHYAAYADSTQIPFRIGLATDQATIIPVTFLLPQEQVVRDLQTSEPDTVALYNAYAKKIDEETLGFTAYHPYNAEVSSENKRVVMKFPANHSYDLASATLEMLNLSIQATFYGMDEVEFLQEDGSPIEFDQVGEVAEPITLTGAAKHQAYYRFTQSNAEQLLSSNFGQSYETVEEALEAMKETPNDIYSSVVPSNIDFTVTEEQGIVHVKFTQQLDLDRLQLEDAMQLIEGILLTVASFDKQVQFSHIVQENWMNFDFTQPVKKPIGANPKYLIIE